MLVLSGALDRLHLGDLLEWLHLTKASGRLALSSASTTRAFDIVRGRVAFVSSSRAAERLGSWLLRKGLASRGALLRALATSMTRGEPFTEVAERDAGVTRATMVEAGRSLATALASRIMREDRVTFRFDPAWPVTAHLFVDLQLQCSKLMMQAAYTVDTRPPGEPPRGNRPSTLDPETMEAVFWRVVESLDDDPLTGPELAEAHRTLLAVGDLLHRWVTQGRPLLPLSEADAELVESRLAARRPVQLEDSPTLAWDLLAIVNGLDAPGMPRAASATQAWEMAGGDAPLLVGLLLDNPRWRREAADAGQATLRRVCRARTAAARVLGPAAGLDVETAATAVALQVVLLELVLTALAARPLAGAAMQRAALRAVLPLVGQAAGFTAGLPEALLAALAGAPRGHPGAQLSGLVALATEEGGGGVYPGEAPLGTSDPKVAAAIATARRAAERAAEHAAQLAQD
jgi:hypothetical protein